MRGYTLVVEYNGGLDPEKDKAIRKIVAESLPGGSGYCLFGKATRDLSFSFKTKEGASTAKTKLKEAKIKGLTTRIDKD